MFVLILLLFVLFSPALDFIGFPHPLSLRVSLPSGPLCAAFPVVCPACAATLLLLLLLLLGSPTVEPPPLPLMTFQYVHTDFAFLVFATFCCWLLPVFLVVCFFSLLFVLLLLPLLRFTVVFGVAFVAAASFCCYCL